MTAFDRERFDAHGEAMLLCAHDGRVLEANPRARYLFGSSLARVEERGLAALSAEDEGFTAERLGEHFFRAAREDEDRFEWTVRLRDGTSLRTELWLVRLDDVDGEPRLLATLAMRERVESVEAASARFGESHFLGAMLSAVRGSALGFYGAWPGMVIGAVLGALGALTGVLSGGGAGVILGCVFAPLILAGGAVTGAVTGGVVGFLVGAILGGLGRLVRYAFVAGQQNDDDQG